MSGSSDFFCFKTSSRCFFWASGLRFLLELMVDKNEILPVQFTGILFLWKFHFLVFVKGKKLWDILEGSAEQTEKNTSSDSQKNWDAQKAQVISWLLSSVTPSITLNLRLRMHEKAHDMRNYLSCIFHQDNDTH